MGRMLEVRPKLWIGVVGDFEHFKGSKLYKARFSHVVVDRRIDFVRFSGNHAYHKILAWEPFSKVSMPETNVKTVNGSLGKIDKRSIDRIHGEVFGTTIVIDPMTHEGAFLEKDGGTDEGAGHTRNHTDFIIHTKPVLHPNPESIYVRLLDNSTDDGYFLDYRLYVVKGRLYSKGCLFVLRDRFETQSGGSIRKRIFPIGEMFSDDELEKLQFLVGHVRLDYGELDVLRDNADKSIYVVDINNTPYGDFRKVGFSRSEIKAIYRRTLFD